MLDSGAFPWRIVLALSIVALRFVIDLTGGMEWRDLALGLFESPIFFCFAVRAF
jgi:hypothetical protein